MPPSLNFLSPREFDHRALHALDDTEAVLDWSKIEPILSSIYAAKTGRPSYPLLTLFRGLLLGVWYRLSDVQLSQWLYRDLLFRKFCHLELGGDVPEASTLGRFRNQLVEHDLWECLLGEINGQLEAKSIILTQGRINIIDATPVEAAQSGSGKGKDGQYSIRDFWLMSSRPMVRGICSLARLPLKWCVAPL